MKRQPRNTLSISRETLRHLGRAELGRAVGGDIPDPDQTDFCVTHWCQTETRGCPTRVLQDCIVG
jgi:hypothetical protein